MTREPIFLSVFFFAFCVDFVAWVYLPCVCHHLLRQIIETFFHGFCHAYFSYTADKMTPFSLATVQWKIAAVCVFQMAFYRNEGL